MRLRTRIETKLIEQLSPYHLELINESHQHSVPANSETHWRVTLVSAAFEGQGLVARHRLIYAALGDEMRDGIHALSMDLMSPAEFEATGGQLPPSPLCRGGSKQS
ncbi:MAG: BolA family transcriptional regulator [Myxococcales bacterium]|nr:BolA family transcriptional regulator [Myxococcales bacterium]